MRDASDRDGDSGALVIAIAIVLLLVIGGAVGLYLVRSQQQMVAVERARAMEARARAKTTRIAAEQAKRAESAIIEKTSEIETAIRSTLDMCQSRWNSGELRGFMEAYWQSDELAVSSDGELTRGWAKVLEHYQATHPSPADMGQLAFAEIHITPFDAESAAVVGQWTRTTPSGKQTGTFTFHLSHIEDGWVITHDHRSSRR